MSDLQGRLAQACERLGIEAYAYGLQPKGESPRPLPVPDLIERLEAWADATRERKWQRINAVMAMLEIGRYDWPESAVEKVLAMTESQRGEAVLAVAEKEES